MACMLRRMLLYSNALVFKARPDDAGYAMMDRLSESGVHVTLLMDCAVARCVAAVSLMVSSDWLIIYFWIRLFSFFFCYYLPCHHCYAAIVLFTRPMRFLW